MHKRPQFRRFDSRWTRTLTALRLAGNTVRGHLGAVGSGCSGTGERCPLQASPRQGQSLCEGDVNGHSVHAGPRRSTGRPSRRLRLLCISMGVPPPPPRACARARAGQYLAVRTLLTRLRNLRPEGVCGASSPNSEASASSVTRWYMWFMGTLTMSLGVQRGRGSGGAGGGGGAGALRSGAGCAEQGTPARVIEERNAKPQ